VEVNIHQEFGNTPKKNKSIGFQRETFNTIEIMIKTIVEEVEF
jgi:hypothetical protein